MGATWSNQIIFPLDRATKLSNEVPLSEAPDYVNPEFEAVEIAEGEGEGDGEEEDE